MLVLDGLEMLDWLGVLDSFVALVAGEMRSMQSPICTTASPFSSTRSWMGIPFT